MSPIYETYSLIWVLNYDKEDNAYISFYFHYGKMEENNNTNNTKWL